MAYSSGFDYSEIHKLIKKKADKVKADKATAVKTKSDKQTEIDALPGNTVSERLKKSQGAGPQTDMDKDVLKGTGFAEAVLGEEGLGRLGEDETLKGMESQAAELAKGFSSEESLARQEKGIEGIQGGVSSQQRNLQAIMARAGVKGQAAGAQLGQVAQSGIQARGNLERDLLIGNRQAQLEGLNAQQGIHSQTIANSKFDLGQAAKEKNIALQGGLGFAALGSVERGSKLAADAAVAGAKASGGGGGGGTSFVCSALHRCGLMSGKETAIMLKLMLRAVIKHTKFLSWYFKEAPNLANDIYHRSTREDFLKIKKVTVTEVMDIISTGDMDKASIKYIQEIINLAKEYNYTVGENLEESSIFNTIKYLPSLFALKTTRVWVKSFLSLKTRSTWRKLSNA
jgi:hypothetical protein